MLQYVHHVHYVVPDRDAMVDYIEKNFGLKPDHLVVNHNGKEAQYDIGQTQIQVVEPADLSTPMGQYLKRNGPGVWHVAWAVNDIQKVTEELAAKGNKMRFSEEKGYSKSGAHDYLVCNLDPASSLGLRFQLIAEPDNSGAGQDKAPTKK